MTNNHVGRQPITGISEKITRNHRERQAMVYIRQSTMQQLDRNQESTRLQYALAERAFQLGWARDSITIIDDDLGCSGASIEGRPGFRRLVTEVELGHVGLVIGIEMSRLARSCRDWHQLLETCASFDTLIADADGVYHPSLFNDRLLLGLKGTMSEAELHVLKARMQEGRRAKARRGDLGKPVPMGYLRRPSGEIVFDPDEQAQTTIHLVFKLFEELRSVGKVLRYLAEHAMTLPVRSASGSNKGDLTWRCANRSSLYHVFGNPIYAGVYAYGVRAVDKRRQKPGRPGAGRRSARAGIGKAEVFLPDRLPAYISWEQFQRNLAQLQKNQPNQTGTARAGTALLSGLLLCGHCGLRMTACYNNNGHTARYACSGETASSGRRYCQSLLAEPVDREVTRLVLAAMAPAALEVSLAVAANVQAERQNLEQNWRQKLERAQYQADKARRCYASADPENRLVARTLERDWETALAEQAQLAAEHNRFQHERPQAPGPADLAAIRRLADNVPTLWQAPATTRAERQTIVRLLLERIVLTVINGSEQVRLTCHWQGGCQTVHDFTRPVACAQALSTYPALIERISALHHAGNSNRAIAAILNQEAWRPPKRCGVFSAAMAGRLLITAGVTQPKPRPSRIPPVRQPDEWTIRDLAKELGVSQPTLYLWVRQGRLPSHKTPAGFVLITASAETIATLKKPAGPPPQPLVASLPSTSNS